MRERMRTARAIATTAVLLCVSGCGGGGGGDGDTQQAMLGGDEAIQAATAVVRSTVAIVVGLRTEGSVLTATASSCISGSVDASCEVESRQSVVDASFDQCRVPVVGGNVLTADGGLRIQTSDQGTCITGMIADSATVDLDYDDLLQTLADGSGAERLRSHTNGSDRIIPSGAGCAGRNLLEEIDATVDAVTNIRVPSRLVADGTDARVELRNLQLNQTSAGNPCARRVVVNGEMDVDDRANAIRFAQTLNGVTVTFTEANDEASVEIDGDISNECIGDVTLTTVEPIHLHNATDCPTAGLLHVVAAGRVSQIRFSPGGAFAIDYDGDGQFELVASNCQGVTQCTR